MCEVTLGLAPASSEEPLAESWRRLEHPGPRPSPCLTEGGMRPGGHSDQEGGSSPRPSPSKGSGASYAGPRRPRRKPLLSPPSLALSPGATMGKGGQSPVERGALGSLFGSNPRAFKIGSTPRNTSTHGRTAPPAPERPRSLTRRGGWLLACCPAWLFPGGADSRRLPAASGGAAQGGQRAALQGSTGLTEAPTAASPW